MFTFLHAADVHLDSPLVGLERHGEAPVDELRGATRRAFQNLVDLAIEEKVAFLLLAGDLYDGDWKDYNTGIFFAQQMARLKDAGIRAFVVSGNHDAANQFTKSLRTPDNVIRFSSSRAETRRLDDIGAAIHGRGFATKAVDEDLAAGYPPPDREWFNIGLLHTSLNGRPGHAAYAPCSLDGLRMKEYQYWALGHVHAREEVCREPWVVFPGNVQGRHVRETGPKGCTLVTVDRGEVTDVQERHVDVLRWSRCRVDLSGVVTTDEALGRVGQALERELVAADGRLLAVRLELHGATRAHGALMAYPEHWEQELRAHSLDRCGDSVWLEKVALSTRPEPRPGADAAESEAPAGLPRALQDLAADDALVADLAREFADLRAKLPGELAGPDAPEALDPTAPDVLRGVVEQARELLLARLTAEGR